MQTDFNKHLLVNTFKPKNPAIKLVWLSIVFLLFTLFNSCTLSDDSKREANTVKEVPRLTIKRFDRDLIMGKNDTLGLPVKMTKEYPDFFTLYTRRILMLADTSSLYTAYTLQNFLNDPYISEVFKQTQNKYNNLKDEEQLFSEAFARYSAFFPDKKAPQILSMISAYAYSVVCADHTLAISLEMYMGSEHDAYGKIGIPLYKRRTMDRPYIVPEALYAWLASEFEKEDDNRNLLSMMIFKGKVWYALEQILPGISDTLLSGFTETQQKWCTDNEKKIWSFFIDKKLLFVSLKGDVVKYVNEAPFTAGMPRESPGRTAVWTGYRIVKKYMAEEKNVSIQQLFNLNNAELILKKSKYKP